MRFWRDSKGLTVEFEKKDWRGNWREFIAEIKKWKPKDEWVFDHVTKRWWICDDRVQDFYDLKRYYIDQVSDKRQMDMF